MFLNCEHIYCYHLNRKLYIVLGTDNLNIQIGGTPKLHTLGRYSDSSAKSLNSWNCQQKPLIQSIVLLNEFEFIVLTWGAMPAERTAVYL